MHEGRRFRAVYSIARPAFCTALERRLRRTLPALPLLWLVAVPGSAQSLPPAGISLTEAVGLALANDPLLTIEQARLRAARGALLASRGTFDPVVGASVREVESQDPLSATAIEKQALLGNSLFLSKRFRSGLSIEPELELLRTEGAAGEPAVNIGTVSLTLRQPLLRGRGRAAVTAAERAAERELAASALDLRQTTAERLFAVASRYWLTCAAALALDILRESEERARELLATTRELIAADVTPAAELMQVEANLAAKEAARIGGERALFEARQELGREIGLEPGSIAALPLPSDPFPVLAPEALPPSSAAERFVAAALERRADLLASRERQRGAELLLLSADNSLLPQLDLVFTPSYSGLAEGTTTEAFFTPLYRNVPGASSSLSLTLAWPTRNSRSRGEQELAEAVRQESALLAELQRLRIGADVPAALAAVASQAEQLERTNAAVRLFARAVENEEKKLRAGTSTLIDLISQRDRLTGARQAQVAAHLDLALALARLRFETGTLEAGGADSAELDARRLTTVPFQNWEDAP